MKILLAIGITFAALTLAAPSHAEVKTREIEYSQDGPSGQEFDRLVRERKVGVIHTRPLDLSIDETLHDIV